MLFSGGFDQKLLPRKQRRRGSLKSKRRGKQSHDSARAVCSSWLFWASLCSSRLVSHGWPQRCLEGLMREEGWMGAGGSVSEFTVAACHRTPSLTYSSKWIGWDCVAACAEPTVRLSSRRSSFVTSCWCSLQSSQWTCMKVLNGLHAKVEMKARYSSVCLMDWRSFMSTVDFASVNQFFVV